jgi:hypothetical protein
MRPAKKYGLAFISVITANEIWTEFTNSIMARVNHIKAKAK